MAETPFWDTRYWEMCPDPVVLETRLPLPLVARGKVRDLYDLGGPLLLVATDRISAFDCILATGIPCKGRVLTQMSLFWFDYLRHIIPTHLLPTNTVALSSMLPEFSPLLDGRSLVVKRADMIQVECVARGYLSGSGWKEYAQRGSLCGIALPPGLRESEHLPEPLFTPATKAQTGHDVNVSLSYVANLIGTDLASTLRDLTLKIYQEASAYAFRCGIILADTKLEFGFSNGDLILADEVLTPDSSRYWPADTYKPGGPQVSFDKQYVRDYLETIGWNKQPPAPSLPDDVVAETSNKYKEAYTRLTGRDLFQNYAASAITS